MDLFGYQEFTATADTLTISPLDPALARKARLLGNVLRPSRFAGRTVLDLGANNGYFGLAALQQGASRVTAVDLDPDCVSNLSATRTHLGLDKLDVIGANVVDWTEPADCVFALALSHWLCACTATMGSLDAVVAHLARLTRYLLVLEFVEERDACVRSFGHLTWDGRETTGYSKKALEAALQRYFPRVRPLGETSKTRFLYAAYKTAMDVDLSGPLSLRFPPDRLLACRYLATVDGVPVWSAVFDLGDRVVKQTTGAFALHEARILALLNGHGGRETPKVLASDAGEGWSTVALERIDGVALAEVAATLAADRRAFVRFANGCLDALETLQKASIVHRDIHAQNILVRDGLPVLMDFGWAVAPGLDIEAPPGILTWRQAMTERDATPEHCDVRSIGRLLLDLSGGRHPDLEALFGVMAEPAVSHRIQDPALLRVWLAMLDAVHDAPAPSGPEAAGTPKLLALAEARRRRIREVGAEAAHAGRARIDAETRFRAADDMAACLHARLDAALADNDALEGLTEADWLHLITYARRLCEYGACERAYAVASCAVRSLAPDHPAWAIFSHLRAALEDAGYPGSQMLGSSEGGPHALSRIDGGAVIAAAAFDLATRSLGQPQQADAQRYIQHCLSLIPARRARASDNFEAPPR